MGGDSACGRESVCHGGCCDCERGGGAPDPCRLLSNPVVFSCWMTVAVICDSTSGDRYPVDPLLLTAEFTASSICPELGWYGWGNRCGSG